ncbi:MAG: sodium:proton exchanger [Microbacteriaceae bacterium]|nr:MAG: sodium:proton exchanger [Microbacteriaceae bacterium]
MTDIEPFSVAIFVISAGVMVAVLSNRLSGWIRIPAPALFLIVSAVAAAIFPVLGTVPHEVDERIVTVALIFILFDGGIHIGWKRFRTAAGAVTWLGVAGTVVTAAALATSAHFLFGFDWTTALLIGAALSPTDPAVVFSVLGKREITGRTGTILEGESGANDPVGIALMVSLLAATGTGFSAVAAGVGEFVLQMAIGIVVGVLGGRGLAILMRRVSLPNEALYSVRTIACAALIYAAATILHGSGFLAVLLAGILIGDVHAPYKREIERFSAGIAGLSEIVVFSVLGLSISLSEVFRPDVLSAGIGLAALLIFVIRPVFVGLVMAPIRLRWGDRAFVLWAGLKGAVPILLGMFILSAAVAGAVRVYAIIFIVVLVSVVLQGGLVPLFARLFRVPMRAIEPEPWASGLRFNEEPEGLHRRVIAAGSPADGATVHGLALGESGWVSMINRDGRLVQVRGNTRLQAGDIVLVLGESDADLDRLFALPPTE